MPEWKTQYEGVETMTLAVMGCVVNGPGESKAANIGISLPGTGEAPNCPVFIDGQHLTTLRGTYDELAAAFRELVDDYVATRYPRKTSARESDAQLTGSSRSGSPASAPFSYSFLLASPSASSNAGMPFASEPRPSARSDVFDRSSPGSLVASGSGVAARLRLVLFGVLRHDILQRIAVGSRPFILFSHDSSCGSMSKPGARSWPR